MIHVSASELAQLKSSIAALKDVLGTLDDLGAGIAAIHVDAAINQLKNNLEVVTDETLPAPGIAMSWHSDHPLPSR